MGRDDQGDGVVFRICDSVTGQVIYETDNIQDLSDYLYDQNPKYLTVSVNEKHVKKWQASKD